MIHLGVVLRTSADKPVLRSEARRPSLFILLCYSFAIGGGKGGDPHHKNCWKFQDTSSLLLEFNAGGKNVVLNFQSIFFHIFEADDGS